MTDHAHDHRQDREAVRAGLAGALADATSALEHILLSARLAALGDESALTAWPSAIPERFGSDAAGGLVDAIRAGSLELIPAVRHGAGLELVEALRRAQAFRFLLDADRSAGSLLEPVHGAIEAMLLECSGLPLDDDAAFELSECAELAHARKDWLIPILKDPVGLTTVIAVAEANRSLGPVTVKQVCAVEQLKPELAFDGGRPSPRMIERFSARRGIMVFDDESTAEVRATLEPDWRVSIQFSGEPEQLKRIDKVRLGTQLADPTDEDRDFWRASLAQLGVDTQTLLVNQPIMVLMRNGERFSL